MATKPIEAAISSDEMQVAEFNSEYLGVSHFQLMEAVGANISREIAARTATKPKDTHHIRSRQEWRRRLRSSPTPRFTGTQSPSHTSRPTQRCERRGSKTTTQHNHPNERQHTIRKSLRFIPAKAS